MNRGTPKSMKETAAFAIEDILELGLTSPDAVTTIARRYKDFLAQKFTPDLMADPKIRELWKTINS